MHIYEASFTFWTAVVTRTQYKQFNITVLKQINDPLAFLSGGFKGSQQRWSMYEKDAFANFKASSKLDCMLHGTYSVLVFTDHRNLLFVFAPLSLEPALWGNIVSKVQRLALFLSKFDYAIEHIHGYNNIFRWYHDSVAAWISQRTTIAKETHQCT